MASERASTLSSLSMRWDLTKRDTRTSGWTIWHPGETGLKWRVWHSVLSIGWKYDKRCNEAGSNSFINSLDHTLAQHCYFKQVEYKRKRKRPVSVERETTQSVTEKSLVIPHHCANLGIITVHPIVHCIYNERNVCSVRDVWLYLCLRKNSHNYRTSSSILQLSPIDTTTRLHEIRASDWWCINLCMTHR